MKFTALVAAAVLAAPAIAAPLLSPRQAVCDAGAICPAAEGEVSTESVGVVPSGQQWVVYDDATEDPAVVYDYAGEIAVPWTTLLDQGLETFNRTYSYTGVNGEVRITLPGTTKVSTWSALAVGEPVQSLAASPSAQHRSTTRTCSSPLASTAPSPATVERSPSIAALSCTFGL